MFDRFMDLAKQNKEIEAEQSRRRSRNRAIFFGAVGALGLAWFSKNLAKNTITLMEVMGHGQLLYGRTYDVMVFGAAGVVYLVVNGLLTLMMRLIERKALAFERRN